MNAEAIVLRTWPIREADQIVALFTREFGKLKGVAKSAAKSRRRFGGALEPMTHVRATFLENRGRSWCGWTTSRFCARRCRWQWTIRG